MKKRFIAKLKSNFISLGIGLLAQTLIARGLGPTDYGSFGFLTNFFSRFTNFFDAGTSNGFYIKLSQRQSEFGLISFFISYAVFASFTVCIITIIMHLTGIFNTIFPGQKAYFIFFAMVFVIISWFVGIFGKMADAFGITVHSEILKIFQRGFGLIIIVILYFSNKLNLTNYFYFHYFILIFLAIGLLWIMVSKGHLLLRKLKLSMSQVRAYIKEFYTYGQPLFVYTLIGLIVSILDKWMLQLFSGSVEQGFFWLSVKISVICMIFTTAMSQLIMREFAIAFEKNNIQEMAKLFRRYVPLLYSIAAYLSCFIALEAPKVTLIIGGEIFQNATLTVMIMSFYPIHQTCGHLTSSVFYATGQPKLYRNIGGTFNILRLPLAYFLLAPTEMLGLNTGSVGLAALLVFITIANVNTQLFFNTRFLNLRFWRYVIFQIICVGSLAGCVFTANFLVANFIGFQDEVIYSFLTTGLLYSIIVLSLINIQPAIFGLKKNDLRKLLGIIKKQLH